jgi:hypothetical protein
VRGASALGELLARYPTAKVRVLVVWQPVIETDLGPPAPEVRAPLARDPRVVELWDPDRWMSPRVVARFAAVARAVGTASPFADDAVAWDFVAAFATDAAWSEPFPAPITLPDTPVEKQLAPVEALLRAVR